MLLSHLDGCPSFSARPAHLRLSCKLHPNVRRKGCHLTVFAVLSQVSAPRSQNKASKAYLHHGCACHLDIALTHDYCLCRV